MPKFISRYANHRIRTEKGTIEFKQNEFNTEDKFYVDFIRKHPDFGVIIFEDSVQEPKKGAVK